LDEASGAKELTLPEAENEVKSTRRTTAAVTAAAASGSIRRPKGSRCASRRLTKKLTDFSIDPELGPNAPTRSTTHLIQGAEEKPVMRIVGIDLGARKVVGCELVEKKPVRFTAKRVEDFFRWLGPNTPKARVLIEACREAWHVYDLLTSWGHEVLLLDTTRAKEVGIGRHGRKNDEIDAEKLARVLARGDVPEAHVLTPHRRELRKRVMLRRALVESRSQMAATLRGIVRADGHKLVGCEPARLPEKLRTSGLPEPLRALVEPLVANVKQLNEQLAQLDISLTQLCATEPAVQLLATKKGVSLIVAASFVSVIDEATRFKNAEQVASYLGLVPCEDTTGGRRKLGAITKAGNSYLRALLIEAAWHVLRDVDANDPLHQWGKAIADRKSKRVAVVAIARRLACILWAMWRDGTVYDPAALGSMQARGLRAQAQSAEQRARALEQSAKKLALRMREKHPVLRAQKNMKGLEALSA